MTYRQYKEQVEKDYLVKLMLQTKGNVTQASSLAGVRRVDFYRLLKRFHVEPSEYRVTSGAFTTVA